MTPPVLCIIQARQNSRRLPGKLLLTLAGESLIARAWRIATEAFGKDNVVVAIPGSDCPSPLVEELHRIGAVWYASNADENDLLSRFHGCAHMHLGGVGTPDQIIVRFTPEDHQKEVAGLRYVAAGGTWLPVEIGGEAFTLAELDAAHERETSPYRREHIGHVLWHARDVTIGPECLSIDTQADYDAAVAMVGA